MDPLYNRDMIYKRPIMNVEIGQEENDDIQHWTRHVIQLSRDWIRKIFYLELVPNTPILQAPTRPKRAKGTKVTVLTYQE